MISITAEMTFCLDLRGYVELKKFYLTLVSFMGVE